MNDHELLAHALSREDGPALLDMAISALIDGRGLTYDHAIWLSRKLIAIQTWDNPVTTLNAKKLFGLSERGAPKNKHGAAGASVRQMLALFEIRKRKYGNSKKAWLDVEKACVLKASTPKRMINRAKLKVDSMRVLDDDWLAAIVGPELMKRISD